MFKKIFPFLIIYLFVIVLYYPALSTYFSNDDFFHFKVSITDGSFTSFIKFFGFYSFDIRGVAFYRPIFREVLYNIFYSLSGLNPLPFRLLQFLIHFVNIYLVFKLVYKLFKNKIISFLSAFFFAISTPNVASFYYLAGGIQAQGATMFMLSTLLFFDNYLESKEVKYLIFSFVTFLGGVASHEQAALTPILLIGLIVINYGFKSIFKKGLILWPFFTIIAIYAFLNIKIVGYSSGETQYHLILNPKTTLNTLVWYSGWALGVPETLIDFVEPGLKLNPSLMRYWGDYYKIIFSTFFVSILLIASYMLTLIIKSRSIFKDIRFWFFVAWFPLVLFPVLFLPQHKSTYYLYSALPAFWTVISVIAYRFHENIIKKYQRIGVVLSAILFVTLTTLSTTSAILGRTTYWAVGRGRLAEKLIKETISKYPLLPKDSAIYFTNDLTYPFISNEWKGSSNQAYYALNGADGLQLVYKNPSLKVFYEDINKVPANFSKNKIYSIVAGY